MSQYGHPHRPCVVRPATATPHIRRNLRGPWRRRGAPVPSTPACRGQPALRRGGGGYPSTSWGT